MHHSSQSDMAQSDMAQSDMAQSDMAQSDMAAPRNPLGWLYKVVRNGAISASRSERRRARRQAAVAHRGEPSFTPASGDGIDSAEAAEALEQLPIEQRETIVARIWGGLSLKDIAELTGTSTSTVHRRYRAGLEALREQLEGPLPRTKLADKEPENTIADKRWKS